MAKSKGSKKKKGGSKVRPQRVASRGVRGNRREQAHPAKPSEVLSPSVERVEDEDVQQAGGDFSIVGVGASAGGLEAFTQFLKAMPAETGMELGRQRAGWRRL